MSIAKKLMLIVLVPITALALLGIYEGYVQFQQYRTLRELQGVMSLLSPARTVAHAVQAERGLSVGYASATDGDTPGLKARLDQQRAEVDAALAAFREVFAREQSRLEAEYREEASHVIAAETDIAKLRNIVDKRAADGGTVLDGYNQIVAHSLDLARSSGAIVRDGSLGLRLRGLTAVQITIEKAGLERAAGAAGVASGGFDVNKLRQFTFLGEQQEFLTGEAAKDLPPALATQLKAIAEMPEAIDLRRLRRAIWDGQGAVPGDMTVGGWFSAASARINVLVEFEGKVIEDIDAVVAEGVSRSRTGAIVAIVGAAAITLFSMVSVMVGSRWLVTRPMVVLADICQRLARDEKLDIPYRDRNDEIGVMATSMNEVYSASLARKRVRAALRSTSAQVLIVAKGIVEYINPTLIKSLDEAAPGREVGELLPVGGRLSGFAELSTVVTKALTEAGGRRSTAEFQFGNHQYDLFLAPAIDDDGEDLGVVIEFRDVTSRRAIERALSALLADAARGDFSRRVDADSGDPLLDSMADGLNRLCGMVDSFIVEIAGAMEALARGDLTVEMSGEFQGQLQRTAQDTARSIENLRDLIGAIQAAGGAVDRLSAGLSDDATQLASRTESQAAALQQTSASMEEITRSVTGNANTAASTNELVQQTQASVNSAHGVMTSAVAAIERIEQSSAKISDIITIIQAIAFQTNLLALNAAVEAARAGQAGAGFAVVASEVRALAQRSSDAAKDIDQRIRASVSDIQDGAQLVTEAGQGLQTIRESVDSAAGMIAQIASASRDQASSVGEIREAIGELDRITQENSIIADRTSNAAREIAASSAELRNRTDSFVVAAADRQIAGAGKRAA